MSQQTDSMKSVTREYYFPQQPSLSQDKYPEHPLQGYTNVGLVCMLTLAVSGLLLLNVMIGFIIYRLAQM